MSIVDTDSPQVRIPPPLVGVASLGLGIGLQTLWPIALGLPRWVDPVGLGLAITAIGMLLYCNLLFRKAKTDIKPWKATTFVVQSGPYRYSRNPIYLSFVLVLVGLALYLANPWVFLLQPLYVAFLRYYVIAREERYLTRKFGESYLAYARQVRRWI